MTKERLIEIADGVYKNYVKSCKLNGNYEGRTDTHGYLCQLSLLSDILRTEFDYTYNYKRFR